MYAKDVPVASVGNLETYGLMPDIKDEAARKLALEAFSQIYGGSGKDTISQFISQVGMDALKGADILRTAPEAYSSSVEYADTPIAENMKNIARVMFADVGARVFYTRHGQLRYTRQRTRRPRQAVGRRILSRRRLHGRP